MNALPALAANPAAIPFAIAPPMTVRSVTAAVVVVALLAAAAWALRRSAPASRSRLKVSVDTAVALGDRRSLVVVSVEGRRLLLGLTPSHISLVADLGPGASFDRALGVSMADEGAPR
ncbi:MAG: flagellar biosynthetic protein FliO [Acidobacteria bacterium]|nr:flagellar biosynthetic protein FliO [Acidobacteriota bacterium]